ncbi:hypothetical protein [Lapidilactobacillus luobeiensis]|uniref:hypothetical protein n=1 Tax=Lapidilactobacillus luobeiensis TaxID=2950371 RepID=UPI0021C28FE3|nr:hypothetical protein [Lapidilactobacillus luobeiensis]
MNSKESETGTKDLLILLVLAVGWVVGEVFDLPPRFTILILAICVMITLLNYLKQRKSSYRTKK